MHVHTYFWTTEDSSSFWEKKTQRCLSGHPGVAFRAQPGRVPAAQHREELLGHSTAQDESPDPGSHPCLINAFGCKIALIFHGIGWGLHHLRENQGCRLKSSVEEVMCRAVFALWEKTVELRAEKRRKHCKMAQLNLKSIEYFQWKIDFLGSFCW